jgi:hypothetical protein
MVIRVTLLIEHFNLRQRRCVALQRQDDFLLDRLIEFVALALTPQGSNVDTERFGRVLQGWRLC